MGSEVLNKFYFRFMVFILKYFINFTVIILKSSLVYLKIIFCQLENAPNPLKGAFFNVGQSPLIDLY